MNDAYKLNKDGRVVYIPMGYVLTQKEVITELNAGVHAMNHNKRIEEQGRRQQVRFGKMDPDKGLKQLTAKQIQKFQTEYNIMVSSPTHLKPDTYESKRPPNPPRPLRV